MNTSRDFDLALCVHIAHFERTRESRSSRALLKPILIGERVQIKIDDRRRIITITDVILCRRDTEDVLCVACHYGRGKTLRARVIKVEDLPVAFKIEMYDKFCAQS